MAGQNEFPQGDSFLNKMNPSTNYRCSYCKQDFESEYQRDDHELECSENPVNFECEDF